MSVRYEQTRSRLAGWSAYLAGLSLPVLIIVAVGHRSGFITLVETYAIMALGFSLAALAVVAAFAAFVAIWRDGQSGVGAAVRGLIVGLLVLAMPAMGAWRVVTEPRLNDISTDLANPPPLDRAIRDRTASDAPIDTPTAAEAAEQLAAYPDIVPRHYPVSPARVWQEAKTIVDRKGWRLLAAAEPTEADPAGSIQAVAMTPVFAFRQDVSIRIVPDGDGTRVDMRSAARSAAHDLGSDADRVRGFFAELDAALAGDNGQ